MSGVTGATRARLWTGTSSYLDFLFPELHFSDAPAYSVESDELGLPTAIIPPGSPEKKLWSAQGSLVFADDWLEKDSTDTWTMIEWLNRTVRERAADGLFTLYFERIASLGATVLNDIQYRTIFIGELPDWMTGNLAWGPGERPVWWMLECLVYDEGRVLDYDEDPEHTHTHAITAVTTGPGGKFRIAGDYRRLFVKDNELTTVFAVTGSTNNNGNWAVASVALVSGNTEVTVTGNVQAVADGNIEVANLQTRGARP